MGLLIEGQWRDQWYDTGKSGRFQRENAQRRNWITADGAPGPTGTGGFKAEGGRYRLYVALICPWASRTLMARKLKGLESAISVSFVEPALTDQGWRFAPGADGEAQFPPDDGEEGAHDATTSTSVRGATASGRS